LTFRPQLRHFSESSLSANRKMVAGKGILEQTFAAEMSEIIGRIYDCALDPTRWPVALGAIQSFVGGNRVRIFLFNTNPIHPGDGESFGVDRDFNRAFDRDAETLASIKYGFVVGEMDKAMTLSEVLGTSGGRDVNGRLAYDTRFYREWMEPRGAHDALSVLVFKTAKRFGGLAMTRSSPLPPFGAAEKEKIRLIAPHVRRALTISNLIGEQAAAGNRLMQLIDSLAAPIVIASPTGAIEQMNVAARRLIEARHLVSAERGVLRSVSSTAREALRSALMNGTHRMTTVALDAINGPGLIVTILPLTGNSGGAETVAIFFHADGETTTLPGEAFAKLYKLTGTELRIAMLLVEGANVIEIAERLGSSVETVRWHVKNLRVKTGSARTSDLIRCAARATLSVVAPQ
jgi:DNA-binding CsgD family transcriptional regulator